MSGEHEPPSGRAKVSVLSTDMIEEAIPGNIRKAEHFIAFLKRFIEYLKVSVSCFCDPPS